MKKLILFMSIAAALMSCTAAYAEEYDADSNSLAGVDGSSYRTVLISKDGSTSDNDIVYVGQADGNSTFGASLTFLLKENPAAGEYTLALGGGDSGEVKKLSFTIGEIPETPTDVAADKVFFGTDEMEGTEIKNVAFGWEGIDGSKIKSIVLTLDGKVLGHNFDENDNIPEIAEGSQVNFGVKVTGIPGDTAEASARLSSETLTFENSNTEGE